MNKKILLIILCVVFLTGFSNNPEVNPEVLLPRLSRLPEKQISYLDNFKELNEKLTQDIQVSQKAKYQYIGTFLLTGYDDCYLCQEEFVGTTALGVSPRANHTIAVDPKIIPLGSHILINDIEYVAEDVGGGVKQNHIDIFVGSHAETFSDFCNGYAEVYLVNG